MSPETVRSTPLPNGWGYRHLALFLLLAFLPADGTGFLRVEVFGYRASLLDLLLLALLFLDLVHRAVTGTEVSRFTRITVAIAVVTSLLSAISLLYVRLDRSALDVKVTLNLLQLTVLLYLTSRILSHRAVLRQALLAVLCGVTVMSLGTVLKSLGLDIPGGFRGSIYAFVGPFRLGVVGLSDLGLSFSTAMLLAFPAVLVPDIVRRRWLRVGLAGLLLLASFLSYARGLWLGLMVEGAIAAFALLGGGGGAMRRTVAGVAVIASVVAVGIGGADLADALVAMRARTVLQRFVGFTRSLDVANRGAVSLMFGSGKGYFYTSADDGGVPHNLLLDLLVSKGLTTLAIFALLLLVLAGRLLAIVSASEHSTRRLAIVFLTILAGTLTEGMSAPSLTSMSFLFALALSASFVSVVDSERASGARLAEVVG